MNIHKLQHLANRRQALKSLISELTSESNRLVGKLLTAATATDGRLIDRLNDRWNDSLIARDRAISERRDIDAAIVAEVCSP